MLPPSSVISRPQGFPARIAKGNFGRGDSPGLENSAGGRSALRIRPRRSRCRQCTKTHVLLPVLALLRSVDLAEVIGKALMRKAQGASGHRTIATELSLPATTVREWLRRFFSKAELICSHFTRLAVWLDSSIAPIEPRSSPVADALESIGLAAQAAASMGVCLSVRAPRT